MLLGARHDGRSMFGKLPLRPLLLFICNAGASEAQVLAAGGGGGGAGGVGILRIWLSKVMTQAR